MATGDGLSGRGRCPAAACGTRGSRWSSRFTRTGTATVPSRSTVDVRHAALLREPSDPSSDPAPSARRGPPRHRDPGTRLVARGPGIEGAMCLACVAVTGASLGSVSLVTTRSVVDHASANGNGKPRGFEPPSAPASRLASVSPWARASAGVSRRASVWLWARASARASRLASVCPQARLSAGVSRRASVWPWARASSGASRRASVWLRLPGAAAPGNATAPSSRVRREPEPASTRCKDPRHARSATPPCLQECRLREPSCAEHHRRHREPIRRPHPCQLPPAESLSAMQAQALRSAEWLR